MHEILQAAPALAIAAIIALGVAAQWLSWIIRVPAILFLLAVGFLVGPVLGWVRPAEIFPDSLFFPLVSLAVGLILFEGGLTLRFKEIRETRRVVLNLVTWGGLITWIGGAAAGYFLADLSVPLALLFGSLIIVTGPTVIGPLLRIVRPNSKVGNVLKWEGIVIDAVGALVAVLVLEAIILQSSNESLLSIALLLGRFVLVGASVGAVGGVGLAWLLKRRAIPDFLINVTALALLFATFTLTNLLSSEAGLLAAVVMGIIVANASVPDLESLLSFKEDLTVLFVSMLFIALAANIELPALLSVLSWKTLLLLAVIILVVRPLDVFLSSIGSTLTIKERTLIAWIGPRGIVAASVTSLFAVRLQAAGIAGGSVLVPLVFIVIVGTVLLASLTAKPLGVRLGVADPDPQGYLLLGAHSFARQIAQALTNAGVQVTMADTNRYNVAAARAMGLPTYFGSLLSDRSGDQIRLAGIGRLLALTSNDEANALTAVRYAREFGKANVFQLAPKAGEADGKEQLAENSRGVLFSTDRLTFNRLRALHEAGAEIESHELSETFTLEDFLDSMDDRAVPLFLKNGKVIRTVSERTDPTREQSGSVLALVVPA